MKILKKFKQFSRDIKLIIITALIVSCVGVYAAGECIISATADDVSYNNTTVQAAIDELYDMASTHCPEGYECTRSLYNIMASNSVLDDRASTYVTRSTGINFNDISSDTNGKGIYEIASTKNNPYPIYYYRGAVANNHVLFADFCWKAIRTTDTGGVKMIYNGEPDGSGNCTNTIGIDTLIGTSRFNYNYKSIAYAGYMYGIVYGISLKSLSDLETPYLYGNDVTYSGGTYTLTNTMTSTGTWETDYNTLNNHHYTCFSTGTTCSSVYYVYYTITTQGAFYITLTNGKKVEDAIDEMLNGSNVNTTNSDSKTAIDSWYNTNLSSYRSYIEDTIYCNDREISVLNGWNPNGGDTTKYLYFSPYTRAWTTHSPSLACTRAQDRFTVSSAIGNGALTYPIGMLTSDEIMYVGVRANTINVTHYLYNNQEYFTMSPNSIQNEAAELFAVSENYGNITSRNVFGYEGLRPVISLKPTDVVASGDGTATNPYVIQTT